MRFDIASSPSRTATTADASESLIREWADRVMNLWDHSREADARAGQPSQDLLDACLLRDQGHNRLHLTHPESGGCTERSLRVLSSAALQHA